MASKATSEIQIDINLNYRSCNSRRFLLLVFTRTLMAQLLICITTENNILTEGSLVVIFSLLPGRLYKMWLFNFQGKIS